MSETNNEKLESIIFTDEDGQEIEFFIIEETTLYGEDYILVTEDDPDSEEAECMVLHRTGDDGDEVCYEPVEDDRLLESVLKVFEELLDDTRIEI